MPHDSTGNSRQCLRNRRSCLSFQGLQFDYAPGASSVAAVVQEPGWKTSDVGMPTCSSRDSRNSHHGIGGLFQGHSRGLDLFAALEEQLGLRLQVGVEEVQVMGIDQARSSPTSN